MGGRVEFTRLGNGFDGIRAMQRKLNEMNGLCQCVFQFIDAAGLALKLRNWKKPSTDIEVEKELKK